MEGDGDGGRWKEMEMKGDGGRWREMEGDGERWRECGEGWRETRGGPRCAARSSSSESESEEELLSLEVALDAEGLPRGTEGEEEMNLCRDRRRGEEDQTSSRGDRASAIKPTIT